MNSVIVLVLLGVIWAAVLIPPWLQGRRDARPAATMRSFHRQLWRLGEGPVAGVRRERYGAVRFVSDDGLTAYGPGADGEGLDGEFAYVDGYGPDGGAHLDVDDVDFDGDPDEFEGVSVYGAGPAAGAVAIEPEWASVSPYGPQPASVRRWAQRAPRGRAVAAERSPASARRRAEAYRRRRRVVRTLLIAAVVTLAWALVLDLAAAWAAHATADALLVGYVALLVRRQRRTVERADKVRYLAPIEAPRPAVVVLHGGAAR